MIKPDLASKVLPGETRFPTPSRTVPQLERLLRHHSSLCDTKDCIIESKSPPKSGVYKGIQLELSRAPAIAKAVENTFGRMVGSEEIATLVPCPEGATVGLRIKNATIDGRVQKGILHFTVEHPWFSDVSGYFYQKDGATRVYLDFWVNSPEAPKGSGVALFGDWIDRLRASGVTQIEASMARNNEGSYNGYYTWPRFGFDAPVPEEVREWLPKEFRDAERLSDIMMAPGGPEAWRKEGVEAKGAFSLAEDSTSILVWNHYLNNVRARLAGSS